MKLALTVTALLASEISANIEPVLREFLSLVGTENSDVWTETGGKIKYYKNCEEWKPSYNENTLQYDEDLVALYGQCLSDDTASGKDRCYIKYNPNREEEACYTTNGVSGCTASHFQHTIACLCNHDPHEGAPYGTYTKKVGDNIICVRNNVPRRKKLRWPHPDYLELCNGKGEVDCYGTSCDVVNTQVFTTSVNTYDNWEFAQCNCDDCSTDPSHSAPVGGIQICDNGKKWINRFEDMDSKIDLDITDRTYMCALKCPAGQFIETKNIYTAGAAQPPYTTCISCPKGFYKSSYSITWDQQCTPCPEGKTTKGEGSTASTECSENIIAPDDPLVMLPTKAPNSGSTDTPSTTATAAPTTVPTPATTGDPTSASSAAPTAAPTTASTAAKTPSTTNAAPTEDPTEITPTKGPRPTVNPSSTSSLAFTFLSFIGVMLH